VNYRHAFHAGNFADCMKHALLVWCVQAMQRKATGVMLLDTHAGIGRTDLSGATPNRTGEYRAGIARLLADPPELLAEYLALVRAAGENIYPGSPELLLALARKQDRVVLNEMHPEDAAVLRRLYRGRAAVHERDAYEAWPALLPPPERRALVLVDPPYEATDEFDRLPQALQLAHRKFPAAVTLLWYPIKSRAAPRALHDAVKLSGLSDVVAAELWLREPTDAARLNGCGVLVVNPPYGFTEAAGEILAALLPRLSDNEEGAGHAVLHVADELGR
jgi:23S rRNA (adenine2030-N6)-methyltransferase